MADKKNNNNGDDGFGDWVNNNGTLIGFIIGACFVIAFLWNAIAGLF